MEFNFMAVLVSSLVTLLIGFVWYHPKVFGTIWMRESGITEDQLKNSNMAKIFGLTLFYSVLFAFMMPTLVIHQMGAQSMIGGGQMAAAAQPSYAAFMADYGDAFRTYKHGAFHGVLACLFLILPVVAINGLFERRSAKYILIHTGYWLVVMGIMGAIICGWK